jgi:hypothetical protein
MRCIRSFLPRGINGQQANLSLVIASTGIAPVDCRINVAAVDRIEVDIVKFLPQYFFISDELWVAAFLPELIACIGFMRFLPKFKLLQELIFLVLF